MLHHCLLTLTWCAYVPHDQPLFITENDSMQQVQCNMMSIVNFFNRAKWGANNIGANQIGGANEVKQAAKDRRLLATTPAVKQARNERRANDRRLATHKVKEAAKDTRFMATTTALYYCPCPCYTAATPMYPLQCNNKPMRNINSAYILQCNNNALHCTAFPCPCK